jgi:hypothetical protein
MIRDKAYIYNNYEPLGIWWKKIMNKKRVVLLLTLCITLANCSSFTSDSSEKSSESDTLSEKTTDELIQMLDRAGNANDPYFHDFGEITKELGRRGETASQAAPALAKAIAYRRRDSGQAGKALIPMKQSAANAIPTLLQNLSNERANVRLYSIFSLGFIGKPAECSVPNLGGMLWDKDHAVRSAAAAAIESITSIDLVWEEEQLDPELYGGVFLDEPEGALTEKARVWWQEIGQDIKWPTENCVPAQ